MVRDIEIEARSFIDKKEYGRLVEFMDENAKFLREVNDETVYFDPDGNLRIRKDNETSYLIVKGGKIHDKHRQEIEIECKREDFKNLEKILEALGFTVEIRWHRKRKEYKWNKVKVLLDNTKGYGYIIELEVMENKRNKDEIHNFLKEKLKSLGIKITPKGIFDKKFEYYKRNWRRLIT